MNPQWQYRRINPHMPGVAGDDFWDRYYATKGDTVAYGVALIGTMSISDAHLLAKLPRFTIRDTPGTNDTVIHLDPVTSNKGYTVDLGKFKDFVTLVERNDTEAGMGAAKKKAAPLPPRRH